MSLLQLCGQGSHGHDNQLCCGLPLCPWESAVPCFSICKDKIMLCPCFCGCTGSTKLRAFLTTMIAEAPRIHLGSYLSKPISTWGFSVVIQSSCQYLRCPNTSSPLISPLYFCAVVAILEWGLYQSVSLCFFFFFLAEVIVNALTPFKGNRHLVWQDLCEQFVVAFEAFRSGESKLHCQ